MSCRDLINAKWKIGGQFSARHKKFARFDKTIPGLNIQIDHGECDIEGWIVKAQYKKPGWVDTDPCIYDEATVTNNNVLFPLEGTLFGENGIWEIEATLKGPAGESRDSVDTIKYEVVETCEGTEVPPIPPESTCNTVDELIAALRAIIDEGNLAEIDWTATINAGNTAEQDWILTIVAGDEAEAEWQITIDTGNAANLVWLQTISDGNDLKDDLEALIAGGDLIQKGAGFDDAKYPYLKDVTNSLEEKYYKLDDRLVYAFEPYKRNIENLKYGMYVKNPLTNGDGTIKSEDVDSMAGVFDDENESFHCGEGYENLMSGYNFSGQDGVSATEVISDKKDYRKWTLDGLMTGPTLGFFDNIGLPFLSNGSPIYFQIEYILKIGGIEYEIQIRNFRSSDFDSDYGENGVLKYSATIADESGNQIQFVRLDASDLVLDDSTDYIYIKKLQYSNTEPVPFVKDTAPDGKLIIKEGWTTSDYTIINLDENYQEQEYFIDSTGINLHLKSDGVTRNEYVSFSGVYEGILTQSEKDKEIEKVTSGKLYVSNAGVYEPVQGTKRRCNEYGQTKIGVDITSSNTDIQLVETNKRVRIEQWDGTIKIGYIDNLGVITGDGIENINGYIRLKADTNPSVNTPVKVVIEIV